MVCVRERRPDGLVCSSAMNIVLRVLDGSLSIPVMFKITASVCTQKLVCGEEIGRAFF